MPYACLQSSHKTHDKILLLKSASLVDLRFSASNGAWLVQKLGLSRVRLLETVLNPDKPNVRPDDEARWSAHIGSWMS